MPTGVHVDLILTCFFSCENRASERCQPYKRKKKRHCWSFWSKCSCVQEPLSWTFFPFPSPLPFGGSVVLSLARGPAGNHHRQSARGRFWSLCPKTGISHLNVDCENCSPWMRISTESINSFDTEPSHSDEIDAATKLLDKACQKLRGIPDVPPQRITDLETAIRQLRQLSCILDSCTIAASYEVSQAQKALLLMPVQLQGRPQLRLQKSYQFQVQKTNSKTSLLLSWSWQSFPFYYVDASLQSRRFEARRGLGEARRGHATDAKRIGTRTKRGSWGLETI